MPEIPEGAKKPADRVKKEVKAEVEGGAAVMWRGKKITMLDREDWPWDAAEHLGDGRFPLWAQGALTPKSFEFIQAQRPTMRDFNDLMERLMAAAGEDLGESGRSSDS